EQCTAAGGDRQRPAAQRVASVDTALVGPITVAYADGPARVDLVYAAVTVDHADRQPRGRTDPELGCERQRRGDRARREIDLGGKLERDRPPGERERARHDVLRRGSGRAPGKRERERHRPASTWHVATVSLVAIAAGCGRDLDEIDGMFYDGDDRKIH